MCDPRWAALHWQWIVSFSSLIYVRGSVFVSPPDVTLMFARVSQASGWGKGWVAIAKMTVLNL